MKGRNESQERKSGSPRAGLVAPNKRSQEHQPFLIIEKLGKPFYFKKKQAIFSQGDVANAVFYIKEGRVRISMTSKTGKQATIALLGSGDFLGEDALRANEPVRRVAAIALTEVVVLRLANKVMLGALKQEPSVSELLIKYLLERNARVEEDLADQLFNSTEKRLARALLSLAHYGKDEAEMAVLPRTSQETLAGMIGTTRSRVNILMNRFRKRGYVHSDGELKVNSSLLSVLLRD